MTHSLIATSIRCLRLFRIADSTRSFKVFVSRASAVLKSRLSQFLSALCMSELKAAKKVSEATGIRTAYREAGQLLQAGVSLSGAARENPFQT
jgi:hypothetical protein